MSEFTLVGVNGVVLVLWIVASVLAVGCWNVVKFVVTKASGHAMVKGSAPMLDRPSAAPRPSVDLL